MSNRTTIVIDPLTHKAAKQLAKQANMTLGAFIGHLITKQTLEIAELIAENLRDEDPRIQKIRDIVS